MLLWPLRLIVTVFVNMRLRFEKLPGQNVQIGRDVEGIKDVRFKGENAIGRGTIFAGEIFVGYGTTISANSYIIGPVEIGNYCQIGANVGILGRDHPTSYLSTYINRILFDGRLRDHEKLQKVEIGHDVWIGHGSTLLKGVRIGNGSVIGAGSVVTKSFPEFSIVAGNPARLIRQRFPEEIAQLIAASGWWLKTVNELNQCETAFNIDYETSPEDFRNALMEMISAQNK